MDLGQVQEKIVIILHLDKEFVKYWWNLIFRFSVHLHKCSILNLWWVSQKREFYKHKAQVQKTKAAQRAIKLN